MLRGRVFAVPVRSAQPVVRHPGGCGDQHCGWFGSLGVSGRANEQPRGPLGQVPGQPHQELLFRCVEYWLARLAAQAKRPPHVARTAIAGERPTPGRPHSHFALSAGAVGRVTMGCLVQGGGASARPCDVDEPDDVIGVVLVGQPLGRELRQAIAANSWRAVCSVLGAPD